MTKVYVIDEDTTDAFLDRPEPRYGPDRKTIGEILADREAAGLPPPEPIPLPPLTDH